jgi:hypothetical protein
MDEGIFNRMSVEEKYSWLCQEGDFIGSRQSGGHFVSLFSAGGHYIEVWQRAGMNCVSWIEIQKSNLILQEYSKRVRLEGLF